MDISLCMIVKNEEKNLDKCLALASGYFSEIVIVDTGSNDKTKEISQKYTDKVYYFEWCDDFAKARNYAISLTSKDWILTLDADEFITEINTDTIEKFIGKDERKIGRLKRINFFDSSLGTQKYIERVNRLFNKKYFKYLGIIHEQLVALDGSGYETEHIDITLDHTGYKRNVLIDTSKAERNIKLLNIAVSERPHDPYLHYQLGKSYYISKDYQNACQCFETALSMSIDFSLEYVVDLVQSYGYALINCGYYENALELVRYIDYYSNLTDFNFLIALIYLNNGKLEQAYSFFTKCLSMNEGSIEGLNSFLPNYNIGVIFECLGYKEKAAEHYSLCGSYQPALNRLKQLQ
ncbi:MAG: glycosyltransferase [Bacillota bacterium]